MLEQNLPDETRRVLRLSVSSLKNDSKCLCLEIPVVPLLIFEAVSGGRMLPRIGVAVVVVVDDVVTRAVPAAG